MSVIQSKRMVVVLLAVLLALLPSAEGLHLSKHLAIDTYVSLLREAQVEIQSLAADLEEAVNSALEGVAQEQSLDAKIALMEAALGEQDDQIKKIQRKMLVSFKDSELICPNYSEQDSKAIKDQVNQVNNLMAPLPKQLIKLSDTQGIDPIIAEQERMGLEMSLLSTHMDGSIPFAAPDSERIYLSNVASDGWMLGKSTPTVLEQEFSVGDRVVITCPLETPFAASAGAKCISCSQREYFDVSDQKCKPCKHYSEQARICKDTWGVNLNTASKRIILPKDVSLSDLSADMMCPEGLPFYDGEECLDCLEEKTGTYFDYSTRDCTSCAPNTFLNTSSHSCVKKTVYSTNLESKVSYNRIIFQGGANTLQEQRQRVVKLQEDFNVIVCPQERPFSTNTTASEKREDPCVSCPQNQVFNFQKLECAQCAEGQFFNAAAFMCQKIPIYSNLNAGFWISPLPEDQVRKANQKKRLKAGSKQCPVEHPFSNGEECMGCKEGQLFNIDSMECSSCNEKTEYFSFNLKGCRERQQNSAQTNPTISPGLLYQGYDNNHWMYIYFKNLVIDPNLMDCPSEAPFWDEYACVTCPADRPYFNLQYRVCQYCFEGSSYDEAKKECVGESGDIVLQGPVLEEVDEYKLYLADRHKAISEDSIPKSE